MIRVVNKQPMNRKTEKSVKKHEPPTTSGARFAMP